MSSPAKRSPVLGYNHNLRYLGRTWHVQSEDSGVDNPAINTHVFHEGAILSSVRSKYDVTLPEAAVQKLMQAQHKAMMRDLKAGVFDEKIERFYPGSVGKVPAAAKTIVDESAADNAITDEPVGAKTIAMPIIAEPIPPPTVETPIVAQTIATPMPSAVAEFDKAPSTKPSIIPGAVRAAPVTKAPLDKVSHTQKLPMMAPKVGDKVAPPARPPQAPLPAKPAQRSMGAPPSLRAPEDRKVDTQKTPTTAPKNAGARTGVFPPPQPKAPIAAAISPVQRTAPKLVPSPPRVVVASRRSATLPSLDDLQRGRAPIATRTAKTPGIFGEDPSKEKSLDEAILAYLSDDAPEK